MTRYVVTTPVTIAATDYAQPARVHKKGDVVELNAAEVTAIGAGNLRAVSAMSATAARDQLGESFAASNATL
jgi:ATP-dependent protease HslVU (ClpYQ) peptidase subunit